MTVTIAEVALVTLGSDGQATASLNATVANAPSGSLSYAGSVLGNESPIGFSAATVEDTNMMFNTAGTYTFRQTGTAGVVTASDTVDITVRADPIVTVHRLLDGCLHGPRNRCRV